MTIRQAEKRETMYKKVYIEITNICNMNCSFCHGHKRAQRRMTADEFALILGQLKGKTEYLYYHLMGEPLTHPELPLFLQMARENGFRSIITTNGTLLPKCGKDVLQSGVHKVNLSLHSFENGSEEAHAHYVRTLADFAKESANQGVITVFRLWNEGHDGGKNQKAIALLKKEFLGEWKENVRGINLCEKIHLEFGERFEWPDSQAPIKGERFFCYGLKDQFGILADGTVVPCCLDSDGAIALGNIFKEDLKSILDSERARALSEGFRCGKATEDLCRRCGYAQRFVK